MAMPSEPARKTRRGKKKPVADAGAPAAPLPAMQDVDIFAMSDGPVQPSFDPAEGAIEIENGDDTVTIQLGEPDTAKKPSHFDDNLAEEIDSFELGRIANALLEAIEDDERNRSEWLQQRADGLDLLGWKVERPGTGNVGQSSTAVSGQSTVRDGILGEACDRFQANAFAELCPSEGPCKVINYGTETADTDRLAEEFEKDMNFYLTTTAREYYPDTREMLFWTGYASGMFKKVYKCPLRNRPVSERVDGADLIVPSNATDLHNAGRITHQRSMRQSIMKRMQILGVYRDISLTAPTPQPNILATKEANIVGMNINQQRPEDQDYTIYECYCELDIPGFEHKQGKEPTGLPLPYRVTMDKDSRQVLEIRRNWNPPKDGVEDETLPTAKIPFVLFPYATGLSIYGTGLLQRLGNYAMALTAMLRISIDSGMFANFPGFLYAKPMGRQLQNEFRVPPGGGAPIDVSAVGNNINNAVMALPYKPVDQGFVALMGQTRENATRYGGTAEAPTGEGVVNAPVGSVLAAIDQATRIEGGVHKALYAAQREELELLKELFRDDPEALWRGNKRPAMGPDHATRAAKFKAADPNVPSHMHRLAKANTYLQTAMALPGVFNLQRVVSRWAGMVKIDDVQSDFLPQQSGPPPIDPVAQAQIALKAKEVEIKQQQVELAAQKADKDRASKENITSLQLASKHAVASHTDQSQDGETQAQGPDPLDVAALQLKSRQVDLQGHKMALDAHNAHADRESKQTVEAMKIAQAIAVHPLSNQIVDEQLQQMAPFISPTNDGMADGGPARERLTSQPLDDDTAHSIRVALAIAEAMREHRATTGYMQ